MKLYGIVGAGGFGREVMPLAQAQLQASNETYELVFVVEDKTSHDKVNGYSVLTVAEFFAHPIKNKYFNIAIASHIVRKRIAEYFISQGAQAFQVSAANAIQLQNNAIGDGAILCPFTTVTSNATIGKFFHANIYSYIAHDCVIGDYVTFAPNVHCNGNVIIEDCAYIGTGAIIREGTSTKPIVIGHGALIGMGAVVTKSVAANEIVVGNPAQPMQRKVTSTS